MIGHHQRLTRSLGPRRLLAHVPHVDVGDAVSDEHGEVGDELSIPGARTEHLGPQRLEGIGCVCYAVLVGDGIYCLQQRLLARVPAQWELDFGGLAGKENISLMLKKRPYFSRHVFPFQFTSPGLTSVTNLKSMTVTFVYGMHIIQIICNIFFELLL